MKEIVVTHSRHELGACKMRENHRSVHEVTRGWVGEAPCRAM